MLRIGLLAYADVKFSPGYDDYGSVPKTVGVGTPSQHSPLATGGRGMGVDLGGGTVGNDPPHNLMCGDGVAYIPPKIGGER